MHPCYDFFIDPLLEPPPARIAYGSGTTGPVYNADSINIACNTAHQPPLRLIAQARNVTFRWSRWLYSHKGLVTAWMAPYEGDVSEINMNDLEFFKFAEGGVNASVKGIMKLVDKASGT